MYTLNMRRMLTIPIYYKRELRYMACSVWNEYQRLKPTARGTRTHTALDALVEHQKAYYYISMSEVVTS